MCTQVSSQQKIKKNYTSKFFPFIAGVVDTGDKHSFAIISANFRKNSKWSQWDTQRPGGHWFMKKTWSRKSRVRLPLTMLMACIWSAFLASYWTTTSLTETPASVACTLYRAGIFKKSMGARHRGGIGFLYRPARLHRLSEFIPWNQRRGPINI